MLSTADTSVAVLEVAYRRTQSTFYRPLVRHFEGAVWRGVASASASARDSQTGAILGRVCIFVTESGREG